MLHYCDTHAAYLDCVRRCVDLPDCFVAPRGEQTRELLNHVFEVHRPEPEAIRTNDAERNAVIARYTASEFALYESGSNSAADFARHASMWRKIANPDGTVNSAYGWLLFHNRSCCGATPWDWAKQALLRDRDTRQAFLRFSLPEHQWVGNLDQVCTMHGLFLVRAGRLNLTMVMRSNDVYRGLPYDMPWFVYLLHRMSGEVGIPAGSYFHVAHSLHLYERDLVPARRLL